MFVSARRSFNCSCKKTFTVLPSGRYAPECTVRTVGKRRGFVVLIGPELGAVPSVQRNS